MDLESLTGDTMKQPPRKEDNQLQRSELPESCCIERPSAKPSWAEENPEEKYPAEKYSCENRQNDIPSSLPRERSLPCRTTSKQGKRREIVLRPIATAMKDILAITAAAVCVCIMYQHESIQRRLREEERKTMLINAIPSPPCHESSSNPQLYGDELGPEPNRKVALAMKQMGTSKLFKKIAVRTALYEEKSSTKAESRKPNGNQERLSHLLTNPPPLLILFASILFALCFAHILHSQKTKQYRYRNHILSIGLLVGTLVGVLKTEENFLLGGKSYVAGSAVLAMCLSWVGHGILRAGEDCGMSVCEWIWAWMK
ncbi:hypothetical protein DL98DRAFT_601428 [Cadophora sp. DSE1049]|nr:hypothetical protein DL98DRAFT_601428 [Cadophora sp. DSE1049]